MEDPSRRIRGTALRSICVTGKPIARAVQTDVNGTRHFQLLPGPFNSMESVAAFGRLLSELAVGPQAPAVPAEKRDKLIPVEPRKRALPNSGCESAFGKDVAVVFRGARGSCPTNKPHDLSESALVLRDTSMTDRFGKDQHA
jgi:hypothetical protein